jgi:hypothetical protein
VFSNLDKKKKTRNPIHYNIYWNEGPPAATIALEKLCVINRRLEYMVVYLLFKARSGFEKFKIAARFDEVSIFDVALPYVKSVNGFDVTSAILQEYFPNVPIK